MRKNYKQRDRGPQVLANNKIQAERVRVNFADGESKIMNKRDAINEARNQGLDLVLIAEKADPPVCKIIELNKYLYGLKQKEKEQKKAARASQIETKEIRLGLNIDTGDLNTKAKQGIKFIEKGSRLIVTVVLRGRERGKQDLAKDLLNTFAELVGTEYEQISTQNNRVMGKFKS
tara:strand:- start:198 stop:722 length:525 start_codon:yes stop_codon:yes gene_type:complete